MAARDLPASELGLADHECEVAGSPEPVGVCGRVGVAGRRKKAEAPKWEKNWLHELPSWNPLVWRRKIHYVENR